MQNKIEQAKKLEVFLREKIPVANAMAFHVVHWDGVSIRLQAPLDANVNYKDTAFGGSIATLATLAAWCLITLYTEEKFGECDAWAYKSEITYTAPIATDIVVEAVIPLPEVMQKYDQDLKTKSRAKLPIDVRVMDTHSKVGASFTGTFHMGLLS